MNLKTYDARTLPKGSGGPICEESALTIDGRDARITFNKIFVAETGMEGGTLKVRFHQDIDRPQDLYVEVCDHPDAFKVNLQKVNGHQYLHRFQHRRLVNRLFEAMGLPYNEYIKIPIGRQVQPGFYALVTKRIRKLIEPAPKLREIKHKLTDAEMDHFTHKINNAA